MDNFVHLHLHSNYSIKDGIMSASKICDRIKELEQPGVALTDHGVIAGWIKFYREAIKRSIKPILGCEVYLREGKNTYHTTLLCKNNDGIKNMIKLHNMATYTGLQRFRIQIDDLLNNSDGLIVLTGCIGGIIPKNILIDKDVTDYILRFKDRFDKDFYFEIMNHGDGDQDLYNKETKTRNKLREYSKKFGVKCVATNDCHYLDKNGHYAQFMAMLDSKKESIKFHPKTSQMPAEFYIKSREEMIGFLENELDTTIEIYEKCNISIKPIKKTLPILNVDIDRYKIELPKEYEDKYNKEKKILEDANLINYFKVVCDFQQHCRDNNIIMGPGRGSVGGSLYAYAHQIHKVDPVKYGLIFSRFYNAGRAGSMPDIDIDFPKNDIKTVFEYLKNKYGKNNICHIGVSCSATVKSAIKIACRTHNVDFKISNEYTKLVPDKAKTVEDILKNPDAQKRYNEDKVFKKSIDNAMQINDLNYSFGVHASGVIISRINLKDIVPLRIDKEMNLPISFWDMEDLEWLGFMKFDFLKIDTLDIIKLTLEQIGKKNYDFIIDNFDEEVFKFITSDTHIGLFQLSSAGISALVTQINPTDITEMANIIAIYRPGPLHSEVDKKYIAVKNGEMEPFYIHDKLKPILKETFGNLIYQESVIKICMELAGFTETEADEMRKIMGKKKEDKLKEVKPKFFYGCTKNNISNDIADELWDAMAAHAEYSFNKAHALEYAFITYITAYLKKYYPKEFLSSCLSMSREESETSKYLNEARRLSINVELPNVKLSKKNFHASDNGILYSLGAIHDAGEKIIDKIIKWQDGNELSLQSLLETVKPNRKVLEALIRSGAFDCYNDGESLRDYRGRMLYRLVDSNKINLNLDLFEDTLLYLPLTKSEMLLDEKKYLGAFITENPLDKYSASIRKNFDVIDGNNIPNGLSSIVGIAMHVKSRTSKKGNPYGEVLLLQKNNYPIQCLFFSKVWARYYEDINENDIIAVSGQCWSANTFAIDKLLKVIKIGEKNDSE